MDSDLAGRVRNTSLPKSKNLLPFFEAVVNSIQALDDSSRPPEERRIEVEIIRHPVLKEGKNGKELLPGPIKDIEIFDNGPGFNDENMQSFRKLDSTNKQQYGCKGFGRVLWLKAFGKTEVESVYKDKEGQFHARNFAFSLTSSPEIQPIGTEETTEKDTWTKVKLQNLSNDYSCNKNTDSIAQSLLDHCIWYFLQPGGAPNIFLKDGDSSIRLQDVFDSRCQEIATPEQIAIGEESFDLTHVKVRSSGQKDSFIAFAANSRLVRKDSLDGKISGFLSPMHDDTGAYSYVCFVSSPYLDVRVRSERTDFDIPAKSTPDDALKELSWEEIERSVLQSVQTKLKDDLAQNLKKAEEELQSFIDSDAPQYRILMEDIRSEQDFPPCGSTASEKEQFLHKRMLKRREHLREEGSSLLKDAGEKPYEDYAQKMKAYLRDVSDQNKSALVDHVIHRKVILDILEKAMTRKDDGKYSREESIHTLIMPLRKDSNHMEFEDMNLWLIDDRLAYHNYLASDKPLNQTPITDSKSTDRPDILALQVPDTPMLVSDRPLPLSAITVVELKRPMRSDVDKKTPVDQAIGYIDELRSGRLTTAQGRPIQPADNIPAFCYIITDVVGKELEKMIKDFSLTPTADNLSYFGYSNGHKVYVEVITYDGLLNAAKERNKIFFDKLGLKGF